MGYPPLATYHHSWITTWNLLPNPMKLYFSLGASRLKASVFGVSSLTIHIFPQKKSMSLLLIWLIPVSNSTPGQKTNRLFPTTDSACSVLDVMRLAARLHELSNHSCGLQILNYRVVSIIVKFVFDSPERYTPGNLWLLDYSYGMWLVDCLKYMTQWVSILVTYTHTHTCVCMMYVCLCVNTYNEVNSVALGLDLVSWKFDSVKVHMPLSIIMKSQRDWKTKVVF